MALREIPSPWATAAGPISRTPRREVRSQVLAALISLGELHDPPSEGSLLVRGEVALRTRHDLMVSGRLGFSGDLGRSNKEVEMLKHGRTWVGIVLAVVVILPMGIAYGITRSVSVPGTRASCIDWASVTAPATTSSTTWTNVPGMVVKDTLAQNFAVQVSGTFEGSQPQVRVVDASIGGTSTLDPGQTTVGVGLVRHCLLVHLGRYESGRASAHVPVAMASVVGGEQHDGCRRPDRSLPRSPDPGHLLSDRPRTPLTLREKRRRVKIGGRFAGERRGRGPSEGGAGW